MTKQLLKNDAVETADDTISHIQVSEAFLENLELESLCDDTRDEILSWFQNPTFKYWQDMSEQEQRDFAQDAQDCVRHLIRSITSAVAAAGYDCFQGYVEQLNVRDDIKLVIKSENNDANYNNAGRVRHKSVLIVNVDADEYARSRREAAIDPDQPELSTAKATAEIWNEQDQQEPA